MIQVENLAKYYGDVAAIKSVGFDVDRCKFISGAIAGVDDAGDGR